MQDQRVYNMILCKKSFGQSKDITYALLGYENGKTWNLLGGKQDDTDKTSEDAGARELYEESGKFFDKQNDPNYWGKLQTYSHTKHLVFIHPSGYLDCNIAKLNEATKLCSLDTSLTHDFKEMHRYQIIKLIDLINLADSQKSRGEFCKYKHPQEKEPMVIDGWLLHSLKSAGKSKLSQFI
jgi:hypothetical protein